MTSSVKPEVHNLSQRRTIEHALTFHRCIHWPASFLGHIWVGGDDSGMQLPTKFHHPMFNRSEVIMLTNKQRDYASNTHLALLCYAYGKILQPQLFQSRVVVTVDVVIATTGTCCCTCCALTSWEKSVDSCDTCFNYSQLRLV